jgi:peroxiredoxin
MAVASRVSGRAGDDFWLGGRTSPWARDFSEAKLLSALDVEQRDWKGTPSWTRTTFLVDPTGVVRKTYAKVDPNGHDKAVLADLAAMKG